MTDDVLPSAVATVVDALDELGMVLGNERYARCARRTAATHLRSAGPCGHWAATLWRAWFRMA